MSKTTKSKLTVVIGVIIVITATTVVIVGSSKVANKQLNEGKMTREECSKVAADDYTILIEGSVAKPSHVNAKQCDRLSVINFDKIPRVMAFGVHDKHRPYDGVSEKPLGEGEEFKVTLIQTGDFLVHDHNNEAVQTTFTVKPR